MVALHEGKEQYYDNCNHSKMKEKQQLSTIPKHTENREARFLKYVGGSLISITVPPFSIISKSAFMNDIHKLPKMYLT